MGAKETITQIYVGYYDRAPDPVGLQYWIGRLNDGMSVADIAQSFSVQDESTAKYPYLVTPDVISPKSFINDIYQNLFNRAPDAEGEAYWLAQLAGGTPVGEMIIDIISGAKDDDTNKDKTMLDNKVAVGIDFAEDTGLISGLDYENNTAAKKAAADVLDGVDATEASVTAAKAETDAFVSGEGVVGKTLNLTTGIDQGDAFVGTSNNDTFVSDNTVGAAPTASAADILDGGAGTDTLNIYSGPGLGISVPQISNIENVNIFDADVNVDFSGATGAKMVTMTRGDGQKTVTVADGTEVGFKDITLASDGAAVDLGANFGGTATAATVHLDKISAGTTPGNDDVTIMGAKLTDVTIKTAGTKSAVNSLNVAGATKVTVDAGVDLSTAGLNTTGIDGTLMVTGAGKITLGALDPGFDTIDASGNTGGVLATLDGEKDTNFKGSSGDDTVTAGSSYAASATAAIDGGDGTDSLILTNSNQIDAAAEGARYTNFETLNLFNSGAGAVDMDHIAGITKVVLDDDGAGASVKDLSAAQAAAITVADGSGGLGINVKGATDVGQKDVVKVSATTQETAGANTIAFGAVSMAGVETLEITGNSTTSDTTAALSKTGSVTLTTAGATALENIKLVNGGVNNTNVADNNSITVDAGHTGLNLVVDASGTTGDTTINAAAYNTATGTKLTGGSGNDVLSGSGQADTIVGGAGDDTITGDAATTVLTAGTAQVSTLTVAGTIEVGDVFTATVNGTDYSFTAAATTAASVATGLAGVIGNAGGALGGAASAAGGVVTLTGQGNGSAFTLSSTASNVQAVKETSTITVATGTYDVGDVITTTVQGTAVTYTVAGTPEDQDAVAAGIAAAIQGNGATAAVVDATAATNIVTLTSDIAGVAYSLTSTVTTNAAATQATETLTPSDLETGELFTVTVGGSSYSEVFNTDVSTTLANFVTSHGAAINAQTGGTLSSTATTVVITGPASGAALTGGGVAAGITGGDGGTVSAASVAGVSVTANANPTVAETVAAVQQGATNTQDLNSATTQTAVAEVTSGGSAADKLTGGTGDDVFTFLAGGSNAANVDVITDLDLGSNAASGSVDTLSFQDTFGGTLTTTTLAASEPTIDAQANLTAAFGVAVAALSDGEAATFTYGSKTYLAFDGATNDYLVDVTGMTGTLDASDLAVF
ncbi:DUF4214 domain-containing protein [Maritalea porphyrae]|uniref:DUF4214 domain-containing protein n=1 Tax=Maritalea porphyrae TaxID=880732 RepID=A0ABQ5UR95_9HYPH|nr:DUF4214 domain-containing protein [Maritalea porphyrae]GLQ17177.1 hypothetical protein GCM10007879_14260 [Maritalea porphyrae]